MKRPTAPQVAKFRRSLAPQANGCILFMGVEGTRDGYGRFQAGPGEPRVMAHVWAYNAYKGPVPEGMQVGHVCHDRAVERGECAGGAGCPHRRCCNPEHLEAQTPSENTLVQNHYARSRRTCPQGHPYEGANLIVGKDGKRRCRECDKARKMRSRQK